MYYAWPSSGASAPGFVWVFELASRPSVNGADAAGNGTAAPVAPGEPAYKITPATIDHHMCYVPVSIPAPPNTCGEWYEYAPYGEPVGGARFALTTWSWIDVAGGGIARAAVAEGELFYPANVQPISKPSYSGQNGSVNGTVTVRYGYVNTGTQKLYGWMVTSHTLNGLCYNHMAYAGGGTPLPSTLCPSVSTGGQTGVTPTQATLNGTVYPNGSDTHYYFQYGTTTSYGSTQPAPPGTDAGSAGTVPASTTVGLSPGTTYHYRIVAVNNIGTSYGSDQEFATPGPVEAATNPATGIRQAEATLNGTVNPRGYDAKYYYQYGITASYGSVTPEGDAGEGVGAVSQPAAITGLQPGTIYHDRLVATSGGITSRGKDEEFTTEAMATPSAVASWNNNQNVYYTGTNGQVEYWYWNGSTWTSGALGYTNRVVGGPSAVELTNGNQDVFYRGTEGALWDWHWNGSSWSLKQWGESGKVAGNPAAVVQESTGNEDVYYRGTNGALWDWSINKNGEEYHLSQWGEAEKIAGDPAAIVLQSNGSRDVYYRGTTGALWDWYINNTRTEYHLSQWGEAGKLAGNPSAVMLQSNGSRNVYYRGTSGALWDWYINNTRTEYHLTQWGEAGKLAGNPFVVLTANGGEYVFFRGPEGALSYWYIKGSEWTVKQLGYFEVLGGDPTAIVSPNGLLDAYYGGTNGQISAWYNTGGSWYFNEL